MRTQQLLSGHMGKRLKALPSPAVSGRVVCLLPPSSTSTLMWPFVWPWKTIRCRVEVRACMAYLHDAKLVCNRKRLQLETIITDLEYTDDMALVADSWDDLKVMLDTIAESCKGLGLSISCTTTKTMAMLPDLFPRPEPVHPFPNDAPVEVVSHFQYLGSIVQDDCSSDLEVDSRICKFQSLSCILWYQWKIKPCTKLHILNTIILPMLLYGLKSTVLHEQQIQQLQTLSCVASELFLGFLSGT